MKTGLKIFWGLQPAAFSIFLCCLVAKRLILNGDFLAEDEQCVQRPERTSCITEEPSMKQTVRASRGRTVDDADIRQLGLACERAKSLRCSAVRCACFVGRSDLEQ